MKKLQYYIDQFVAEFKYVSINFGYFFSKKKKAIYIGCTGHDNLGDEGVLLAIRELLKEKIFLYPISYSKPSSGKYLRRFIIRKPDILILGGGTIIIKSEKESYLKLFSEYHKNFPKAKLIVFGAGVADPIHANNIGFPTNVPDWKSILEKCSFLAVRGHLSKSILKDSWGINKEINILHDPAIYFKRIELKRKQKKKTIGINFCNILGRIYGLDQNNIEKFAVNIVNRLLLDGWNIYLFPTAKSDVPYMKKVFGSEIVSKIQVHYDYENIENSLTFLENLDVFLGQRLHSVIFAAITYTPFYAIEYESKTSDFLKTLGIHGVSLRTDHLDVEKVLDMINVLYSNIEVEQNKLFKLVNVAHKEQTSISEYLLNQT